MDAALLRLEQSRAAAGRLQDLFKESALSTTLAEAASGFVQMSANLLSNATATALNGEIGPQRRCDWTTCPLDALQDIRKKSGAKVNDVLLAAVCGAVRRYLVGKKVAVDDLPFRVMVPVSTRSADTANPGGNRVSNMTIPLPLFETDPRRRLRSIVDTTLKAKASGQSWVADALLQALDWSGVQIPAPLVRFAAQQMPANLVVTNIPGPQVPQYLLDAQLLASFPIIPLAAGQGLSVAVYSYNGAIHWGFNADRALLPDLADFVRAVDDEVQQLHHAHIPIVLRTRTPLRALPGEKTATAAGTEAAPAPAPVPAKPARSRVKLKQAH
jgi:WS/DGAT/MGAT family acyltransferase